VAVSPDPATGYANVTIRLTERKRGSWRLSGPAGPASIAGPLQASIATRLPVWASFTISITGLAFAHPLIPGIAVKRFLALGALERPFTPGLGWTSGISIAPQLGWKNTGAGYALRQLDERLAPRISGDRAAQPSLPVVAAGEVRFCEAPKPRLGFVRAPAAMALRFLGTLPVL
jgi:hypothetical protein